MALPVVETTAATAYSADQTSHTVNLPSSIASGNLLFMWFSCDGTGASTTITPPSGWTERSFLSATDRSMLMSRVADGSEGATAVVTTSDSQSSTCVVLRISGASGGFVVGTIEVSGSTAFIAPPAVTPTATVDAMQFVFHSTTGSNAGQTLAPGASGIYEAGNSGAASTTVGSGVYWASMGAVVSGTSEVTIAGSQTGSVAHRQVGVIVQGTSSGGGSSTFNPMKPRALGAHR